MVIFCVRYSRSFWVYLKKHGENADNPSFIIKTLEKRITLETKTGHCLDLLTFETMKLLGNTTKK